MAVGYALPEHISDDSCDSHSAFPEQANGIFSKIIDPACNLCVTDCEDEGCAAVEACTDECFVVACDDPTHGGSNCECELPSQDEYYDVRFIIYRISI